jgi:peptide/nickel transport system permease protein
MNKARRNLLLLITFVLLHGFMLFPGFFAPYDYAEQNRDLPFAPPTHLHFVDSAGAFHLRPFLHPLRQNADESGQYTEDQTRTYRIRLFVSGARYEVLGSWTMRLHLLGVEQPGKIFLFGTDDFGRDELSLCSSAGVFRYLQDC